MESYKNLIVWQKSMDLVILIYEMTKKFPREEIYGISGQMKRAVISIPSNIAEGSRRSSRKDFRNFLINAYGSGAELETQIQITKRLRFEIQENYLKIEELLSEIMRMLNKLINNLKS
ncbi:MAG: hypothetical protein A3D35_03490 [Candidatus Staskawiczbacteria bacterium RIFCSPHIGHO2_02_FULL_34_9]|uniref:Four helix bundle protein n=1 Tax=Candidatus Staskawiczbacteria bacterium RIFCSPHIGHO2_02_FULL_34_9 TaxID=1802206 RepID=A0A1G2I428_9BACT|nr:MAG: hypothetical protein A3D35_03490 [Candidatus Staskawiczbacteria bacterium RIFCSPHIGHO2_02_FULL_34_9]